MALNQSQSCHSIWGWNPNTTIADFPAAYSEPVTLVTEVAVETTSAAIALHARAIHLSVTFQNYNGTCDLELYTSIGGVDTKVWSLAGVTQGNALQYIGNMERVDLGGADVKLHVLNIHNGWVSATATIDA